MHIYVRESLLCNKTLKNGTSTKKAKLYPQMPKCAYAEVRLHDISLIVAWPGKCKESGWLRQKQSTSIRHDNRSLQFAVCHNGQQQIPHLGLLTTEILVCLIIIFSCFVLFSSHDGLSVVVVINKCFLSGEVITSWTGNDSSGSSM